MKKAVDFIKILFLFFVISLCAYQMSGCGGTFMNGASGGTENIAEGDPLSDTESDLFDSGPAEIPVTIAKLEYDLDDDYIEMEFDGDEVVITIAADATSAPYLYIYNVDNAETITIEPPTEVRLPAVAGDIIAFAVAEQEDPVEVGTPVYLQPERAMVIRRASNTKYLNVDAPPVYKDDFAYISITSEDSESVTSLLQVERSSRDIAVVIDEIDGRIMQTAMKSESDNFDGLVLLGVGEAYEAIFDASNNIWADPALAYDYVMDLPVNDGTHPSVQTFFASDGGQFYCDTIWFDGTDTPNTNNTVLRYVDTDGFVTDLTNDFTNRVVQCISRVNSDIVYVLVQPVNAGGLFEPAKILKLDMTDGANAFVNATVEFTQNNNDPVRSFDHDGNGNYFVVMAEAAGTSSKYITVLDKAQATASIIENEGVSGRSLSPFVKISSQGYVVTCNHEDYVGETDDNFLIIHRTGTDNANEFWELVGGDAFNPCVYDFGVTQTDKLSFINSFLEISNPPDNPYPQIMRIDLTKINFSNLTVHTP